MIGRLNHAFAAIALALAGIAAPIAASAQAEDIEAPPGDWTLPGHALTFPDRIGEHARERVIRYGPEDYSVGYNRYIDGQLISVTTLYVYPALDGESCADELEASSAAIANAHPDVERLGEARAASPGGVAGAADLRHYAFATGTPGGRRMLSDLYLYCRDNLRWRVKVRASWFAGAPIGAGWQLVFDAIDWRDTPRD